MNTIHKSLSIPKHRGINIFGTLYKIIRNPIRGLSDEILKAAKLAEQDPRGICQLSLGFQKVFLITHSSHIKQILMNHANDITRAPALESFAYALGEHNIFSLPENDEWKEKRKIIQQWILNIDNLEKNTTPTMQHVIENVVNQILKSETSATQIADLEKFIVSLTMEVACKILLGTNSIIDHTTTLSKALERAMIASINPLNNALIKIMALKKYLGVPSLLRVRKSLHEVYQDCLLNPQESAMMAKESLLMAIANHEKTIRPSDSLLHSNVMFSEALFLLLGGHETTARTIQQALILLADFPDVLEKVRQEMEAHRPRDGIWTRDTLTQLKYLDMVIMECLRLYPPVGSIVRTITKKFDLVSPSGDIDLTFSSGKKFTPPDLVLISPYVTHYLESEFEMATCFIPERFQEKYNHFAWIPFGAGQRNCIGRNFAIKEAKEALIKIVTDYDFSFNLHHPVQIYYQGTLKTEHPIQAQFYSRMHSHQQQSKQYESV